MIDTIWQNFPRVESIMYPFNSNLNWSISSKVVKVSSHQITWEESFSIENFEKPYVDILPSRYKLVAENGLP